MAGVSWECLSDYVQIYRYLGLKIVQRGCIGTENHLFYFFPLFIYFLCGQQNGEETRKELGDLKGQIELFSNKLQVGH